MPGQLVVVRPDGLVGTAPRAARLSTSTSPFACTGGGPNGWAGQAAELERLRHRLDVLQLVLDDQTEHEAVLEQAVAVHRHAVQQPEHRARTSSTYSRAAAGGSIGSSPRSLRSWANAS